MREFQDIVRQTNVRYCLDCGKCTAVCPVSKYNDQFSPRLIVQNALRNHNDGYDDPNIWACIGCNMCSIRCSYNVDYVDFIRYLRMKSRNNGARVTHGHCAIPDSIMHLMGNEQVSQNRMDWIPGDISIDASSDTAFFVGCSPYFDVIFADIKVRTSDSSVGAMRLLNAAGIPFRVLANERCCGHDLLLSGDMEGFMNLGAANIRELKALGIRKLITSCPECYYTLKTDYTDFLADWHFEVQHMLEIPELIGTIKRKSAGIKQLLSVTYHDSCKLGRFLKFQDEPRNLLAAVGGFELVEMKNNRDNATCCGSSPWMFCGAVNKKIQDERLSQAKHTGADYLLTSCPKCQIHFTCAQVSSGVADDKVQIVDLYHIVSQTLVAKENK
jgi:heterodisulfide reductase subunit D